MEEDIKCTYIILLQWEPLKKPLPKSMTKQNTQNPMYFCDSRNELQFFNNNFQHKLKLAAHAYFIEFPSNSI